ncbi:unnamed protein product [Linum trigynum]|uniref:Uncharacterized protein n=1 Tax=Linum trigynum TaxID=586398 RepID=A0AAV2E773_9ROSI
MQDSSVEHSRGGSCDVYSVITRAHDLAVDQPTKLHISTDERSRFNPPLPIGYLGTTSSPRHPRRRQGNWSPWRISGRRSTKWMGEEEEEEEEEKGNLILGWG